MNIAMITSGRSFQICTIPIDLFQQLITLSISLFFQQFYFWISLVRLGKIPTFSRFFLGSVPYYRSDQILKKTCMLRLMLSWNGVLPRFWRWFNWLVNPPTVMLMLVRIMVMVVAVVISLMVILVISLMVILVKMNTCLLSVYLGSDRWVMSVAEMTWGGCFDLFFLQHDHQWLLIVMVVLIFINPMVVRMVTSADLKKTRPDSKSALIFCAIRTDSGDWGSNLRISRKDQKLNRAPYLSSGLLWFDSWRALLKEFDFLVARFSSFFRVIFVLPSSLPSSAETQAKGASNIWFVKRVKKMMMVMSKNQKQQYF